MSALLERAAAPRGAGVPTAADRRRATLALARVEAIRMLRHPVTIAAVLLFAGPILYGWLTGGVPRTPVLQDEDRGLHAAELLVLGGAALVVANLCALRAHRHRTAALYDVLALPAAWRAAAFLLAVVPLGVLAAGLTGARMAVLAAAPAAAGRPSPYEMLAGPASVLLLGAAGVLLAHLLRTAVAAPLLLLGIGVLGYLALAAPGGSALGWLLPVALGTNLHPLPVDLLGRPAGPHLIYVTGLIGLVCAAALARTGARGRRLVAAAAAALAVTAGGGATQLLPPGHDLVAARKTATERPAERQSCRRVEQVTYCAFADFTPWIGEWDAVVRGVLRAVPPGEAARPLTVRQRVFAHGAPTGQAWMVTAEEMQARAQAWRAADVAAGTPNAVTVGTRWGDGRSEVGLAGLVAYEVIARQGAGVYGVACGARGVLIVWLAGQATPATAAGLATVDATSWGAVGFEEPSFGSGISVPDREVAAARALLRRPANEVAAVVRRSWAELTAPDTPTERVGELFGVPVEPQLPAEERSVCTA